MSGNGVAACLRPILIGSMTGVKSWQPRDGESYGEARGLMRSGEFVRPGGSAASRVTEPGIQVSGWYGRAKKLITAGSLVPKLQFGNQRACQNRKEVMDLIASLFYRRLRIS